MTQEHINEVQASIASKVNRQERRFLAAVYAIAAIDESVNHEHVLIFIASVRDSFPDAVHVYTHGACYKFYLILKSIFPCAKPYYDVNHVITKIGDRYYDITGEVAIEKHFLLLDYPMVHQRVIEQCKFPAIIAVYKDLQKRIKKYEAEEPRKY